MNKVFTPDWANWLAHGSWAVFAILLCDLIIRRANER